MSILQDVQPKSAGSVDDPDYWRDILYWLVVEANYDADKVWDMLQFNRWGGLSIGLLPTRLLMYPDFKAMVQDSAPWDFKDRVEQDLGDPVRIGGMWFEYSTAGNILYGFYGRAAGFSLLELQAGAGWAQIEDHNRTGDEVGTLLTLFDTETDYYAVEFGSRLYDETRGQEKPLTIGTFMSELKRYEYLQWMAVRADPGHTEMPKAEGWPYQPGRFNGGE
jgi:hypothetical protein